MIPAAHLSLLWLALAAPGSAPAAYRLQPDHTSITFTYHPMGVLKSTGQIRHADGKGTFDPAAPENSAIEVQIDMDSLTVGNGMVDGALRGPDYFDVAHYPSATFRSTRVTPTGDGTAVVDGLLTLHGITRPVRLTATYHARPGSGTDLDVSVSGTVSRSAFAIGSNGLLAGDEISLRISALAEATDDDW